MTSAALVRFELRARGPFSLGASARLLEGFGPAAQRPANAEGHLHVAFVPDAGGAAVGVCLRDEAGRVVAEVSAPGSPHDDVEALRSQVERILSLDVDGSRFPDVGGRDAVVGGLQQRYPGLRPVNFFSVYEAAAWALISHRVQIRQAAVVRERMAEELGETVEVDGDSRRAFPGPERLASLEGFRGLFGRKVEYLRSLAEATMRGELDARMLRSLPEDEALRRLQRLHGVGPFSAQLILLRGAGAPDQLVLGAPRLRRAVALAYGLPGEPSDEELVEISDAWRPYRSWVTVLLRTMLEDETGEIERGRRAR